MSKTTQTYKWEGAGTKLPSGHTIFATYDHPDGEMWAICDESGSRPHTADDGVLWLDRTRTLTVAAPFCGVPLLHENGNKTSTIVDAATVFYLSRMFRWTVEDEIHGRFYNVR